jgi:ankyrin repeat protein
MSLAALPFPRRLLFIILSTLSLTNLLASDFTATISSDPESKGLRYAEVPSNLEGINNFDDNGMSPLMNACAFGQIEAIKNILKAGADVNLPNKYGYTALFIAVERGFALTVETLIDMGANIHWVDEKTGKSAILIAVAGGFAEITQTLIKAGADVNMPLRNGQSLLMLSSAGHSVEMSSVLISAGARVNYQDSLGNNALMIASTVGDLATVQLLIANKARINDATHLGYTALMFASSRGRLGVVMELLSNGAAPDIVDVFGKSSLSRAVENDLGDIIDALVAFGADMGPKGVRCSPMALERRREYLLSKGP